MQINKEQSLVINEHDRNILLLASAGTGKTDTLSKRISSIITEQKAIPSEILCITFTNKACKEMRDRIEAIVGRDCNDITIKTFHSFCFDVIKTNAKKRTDIFSDFIIFDEEDCKELIKSCNYFNFPISNLQSFTNEIKVSTAKYNLKSNILNEDCRYIINSLFSNSEDKINSICSDRGKLNIELKESLRKSGHILINTYNSMLHSNHGLDFNDLVLKTKELFNDKEVVESLINKYKYINVDEVQDISTLEYFIIEKLFKDNNVLMCGDVFQTIYTWRGSEPDIIMSSFKERYNPLEVVFSKNYRSTKCLTEASLNYLKNAFPDKVLAMYKSGIEAESQVEGENIRLSINDNSRSEAKFIFETIKALNDDNIDIGKTCILTRDNSYNISLSKHLNEMMYVGVDFEFILVDQFKFFRRQEIKDIISFLKLIVNKHDSISLKRIISRLPTGIGDKTFEAIDSPLYKGVGIALSDFIDSNVIAYGEKFSLLIGEFNKGNVIVFDVESTGVDITEDEIIQIAAIKINKNGEVIGAFEKFLKNKKSVSSSQYVHGFSDEFLRENGEDKKKVLKEFIEFTENSVIVGHNVQFDINILTSELERESLGAPKFKTFYDTLDIYRRFHPNIKNHKLDTLSNIFQTNHKPSHNAMDDILATSELLIRAIKLDIIPTSMERMTYMTKHIKAFSDITVKLNSLFETVKNMRPYDIVAHIINTFNIKTLYIGEEGKEKIERLRDFYVLLKELDDKGKSNKDSLLDIVKITGLSNGELESLIINRTKRPRIPIITVHQAKGLEYDNVFIAGVQQNTFPSFRALKSKSLEEEKRLFYVALTRAKKRLYITCNTSGYYGKNDKSILINFIPSKYISY